MKTSFSWVLTVGLLSVMIARAEAQFVYRTNWEGLIITGYRGSDASLPIPREVYGLPVIEIGSGAFQESRRLTGVTIPDTVHRIGSSAFYGCPKLKNVTIGKGVTSIGSRTFGGCPSLTRIFFAGDAPRLDTSALGDNRSSVVYYTHGTAGWRSLFGGLRAVLWNPRVPFSYSVDDGTVTITSYGGPDVSLRIPSRIDFLPVTRIGVGAFTASNVRSVVISNGVTSIGTEAFRNCTNLASVEIPNSITWIGGWALFGCASLTNVVIPGSVTNIELFAFSMSGLASATILDGVPRIGDYAFYHCTNLTNIKLPESLTTIEQCAFEGSGLTHLAIPSGVRSVEDFAFAGADLITVVIPDNVTNLGGFAFAFCPNLTNATIGNGLATIQGNTFYACSNLSRVALGSNVGVIGSLAFGYCVRLSDVSIGENVWAISQLAFAYCASLRTITIPDSVTGLGYEAFVGCRSLQEVSLGRGVALLDQYVFLNCPELNKVCFRGNRPTEYGPAFPDCHPIMYYLPGTVGWGSTFDGQSTVLWRPELRTAEPGFGMQTKQFGFTIAWASGMTVVVEASTNLGDANWYPIQMSTLAGDSLYFSDPGWTNYPNRFYRVRWQ